MSIHPNGPTRPYTEWHIKDSFKLKALESIEHPTEVEKRRILKLRERLYGNLQWFRKVRAHKNDNDTPSPTK